MTRPRQAGSSASAASTQNLWPNLVNTIWNKKYFNLNNLAENRMKNRTEQRMYWN